MRHLDELPSTTALLLADDFMQYYLGAYRPRRRRVEPTGVRRRRARSTAPTRTWRGTPTNPLDEAGGFEVTSTVLPPDQFPQFRSVKGGDYVGANGAVRARRRAVVRRRRSTRTRPTGG